MENTNQNTQLQTENVNPNGTDTTTVVDTPKPVQLKDDDLVEYVVDGQTVTKPYKEVKGGWMRHEDYTRKTQSTSQKIKELQDLYDGLTTREKEVIAKEQMLDRALGRGERTPQQELKDDDVVTVAQVKQILQDFQNGVRTDLTTSLQTFGKKTMEQQTYQKWEGRVQDHADALTKEHPMLAFIPDLTVALKKEAMKDNPQSEAEMFAAINNAGKRLAKRFDDHYDTKRKEEAVRKKNLTEKGPEPKGGLTQFTTQKDYTKKHGRKIDFGAIEKDVTAYLEGSEE